MTFLRGLLLSALVFSFYPKAEAAIGLDVGIGVPFITQASLTYQINDNWSVVGAYGLLDLDVDTASVELSMPSVMVHYAPFAGAFYLGAGVGKESFEASAYDADTDNTATAELDATTTIAQLGWKWGKANGGFWFGMDLSYIMPSSPESSINAGGVPTSSEEYQDLQEALDDFGDTSYMNITFARIGYMF